MGRVTAGTSSDILLKRFTLPRTWCLACASFVAILAQLSGWLITSIDHLVSSVAWRLMLMCSILSRVWQDSVMVYFSVVRP